jgi:hypothetical protein
LSSRPIVRLTGKGMTGAGIVSPVVYSTDGQRINSGTANSAVRIYIETYHAAIGKTRTREQK